jgi:hypothetical protein
MKSGKRSKSIEERRQGLRADRVIALQHRLVKRGGRKAEAVWSLSTTRNMSYSGLLFMSAQPYKEGDVIELEIVLAGMIDIYNGLAEVVRVRSIESDQYDIGARYIHVKFQPRTASRKAKTHKK